ncbi:Chromosome partition protein smc [Methanosarcina barkeri str. Wiesmoor]|uniref:Chromosome partition protein Smc n=2 Tax=Methanosarcina barkeri TaxID=2208 RepID=A0A0E3QGH5_METBA|nr:chromosome segregation protein SMC [Methanosarcina barkeri]AKB49664.1 Chromosome partition protein smc [Methanosarcina barkeri str. Wiesmoor]
MYIKEIEFVNFKSFGKKVKIPFYNDFTTISGPNGSGKSNIIDGILFALGLTSSRTLRAEKLTDLIYNGDASKKPDFAQVTIRFDNSDHKLPLELDEIEVSRKVRRTKNGYYSYFYFNGKSVSLGEVHSQLEKAGITPEGYNVVMQGDVTQIISMTSVERRKIIDEIAGVAEFDERKQKALGELEVVKQQIERVDIILEEVRTQLGKLAGERDQALKYQALKTEKVKFEGYLLLSKLKDARAELQNVEKEITGKEEHLEKVQIVLNERTKELQALEETLEKLSVEIRKKGEDEQLQVKREIEETKGEISRCVDSIELSESELEEADSRRRKAFVEIDSTKGNVEELKEKIEAENLRKESISSELSERKTERMLLQSRIADVDAKFAATRDELMAARKKLEDAKNEKNELIRTEDRLLDTLRRKSLELREIENQIKDAEAAVATSDSDTLSVRYELEKLSENLESLIRDRDDIESSHFRIKEDIKKLENRLHGLQQEYTITETRVRASEQGRGYSRAVEMIIGAARQEDLFGINGTIAQLGRVERQYSTALEVAAGNRMQAIVVDTDADAAEAIEYLKRRKGGRATFLPLNKLREPRRLENLSYENGVIGYAIDLIQFDSGFEPAFWYVFQDTLVMENLESARRLMGKARMVTLEGELLEKSGAMVGGSISSKSGTSFAAAEKDKLLELAEKIRSLDESRNAAINKQDSIESHLFELSRKIRDCEATISRKESQLDEIAGREAKLAELLEAKQADLKAIEESRTELGTEMDRVTAEKADKEKVVSELEEQISGLEAKLADSPLPEINKKIEFVDEELRRLDGRIRDTEATLNALKLEKEYAEQKIAEAKELIREIDEKKASRMEKVNSLKIKIKECEEKLEEKKAREIELSNELIGLQQEREKVQAEHNAVKRRVSISSTTLEKAKQQVLTLKATKNALLDQEKQFVEEILKRGIEETDEVPNYETVYMRIQAIDEALRRLEPVNMRAIDEYNEVELRLSDLQGKRDTLFTEREQLLERIDQYEHLKRDAFMEAYTSINANFKEIFHELSDGMGELLLDNPDDPFAGGMTLRAQPKEKTLQRIEAMSGGEKSLTALAFIFAIQQYRPAPFYAFDEIDMFLDGWNVERVSRRVKTSGSKVQFIVVSLRKPMIQAASRTIGVTMQENNLTSITGVKLNG